MGPFCILYLLSSCICPPWLPFSLFLPDLTHLSYHGYDISPPSPSHECRKNAIASHASPRDSTPRLLIRLPVGLLPSITSLTRKPFAVTHPVRSTYHHFAPSLAPFLWANTFRHWFYAGTRLIFTLSQPKTFCFSDSQPDRQTPTSSFHFL